ncbi:MAG: hypothetical protein ACQER6_00755 [Pseudomonadota bacterium]
MSDPFNLYSEEQIRSAEEQLRELGFDSLSIDNRSGRSPRSETVCISTMDGSDDHVVNGVLMDDYARERLSLIVPRYREQLPMSWADGGIRLRIKRRFADETLGIRAAITGLVTETWEAHREGDPEQALVMIMQVERTEQFEPGVHPG